jgi:uncharacterized repeat protein (TIGR04076 family)
MEINDVKITVIKNVKLPELIDKYGTETVTEVCPVLQEGQEFISKGMNMPQNFCSWAWADIQRDVVHVALGGDYPWIKEKNQIISCCTDGLRPVIMKIEKT